MSWTVPTPPPFPGGPDAGPDRPIVVAYLDYQRWTFRNICAGLSAEQLAARPIAATNLCLQGLLRHLAKVERIWFRERALGLELEPMYAPEFGKDADFEQVEAADAEQDYLRYLDEVRLARDAAKSLDFDATVTRRPGDTMSLRLVHVHMLAEYARHNGHADLIRQSLDGVTGR